MTCPPHDLHDEYLDDFQRRWTAHGVADTLNNMVDAIELLQDKLHRLEAAAIRGEPRNEWGMTDTERIVTWRILQVGLGMDPKLAARSFPSDRTTTSAEPGPRAESVLDEWFR